MILIYGQYVLVPFIFALVLWFTVRIFTAITQKIPFYGKMVPNGVKKIISTLVSTRFTAFLFISTAYWFIWGYKSLRAFKFIPIFAPNSKHSEISEVVFKAFEKKFRFERDVI